MNMSDLILQNINSINLDVVLKIQKDLDPYDLTSLVFLLYEVPDTALQRLIVYQRVSKDVNDNMNLLYHWVSHAQMRPTWKYEFLEALCICRQYSVIKKLGLNVSAVKEHYLPNNINFCIHINPLKKILYRLCESINTDTLHTLKQTLQSFDQDITDYESCELVFLELMCKKFILDRNDLCKHTKVDYQKLTQILEHFPVLSSYSVYISELESKLNNTKNYFIKDMSKNSPLQNTASDVNRTHVSGKCDGTDLDEFYEQLNQFKIEDIDNDLMTDKQKCDDSYDILNPNRIGVCCIINQEDFYPSKENITKSIHVNLTTRYGSTKDQVALQKTMEALNFEVVVYKNLNSKDFMSSLKNVLKKKVHNEDSVFVLCVLSHGVRGHVYAADSVKIKVEDIQCLLDSDLAIKLYGKPKVLILQACQVNDESPSIQTLIPDGPSSELFLRKSDFLIYWATAPEYEAFRQESKGSLFIQFLCVIVKNNAHNDHIHDIFTKVTKIVIDVCSRVQKVQVPIFESTLRKKLFLRR
ncbi:caspase-8 [Pieris napi]|uniref:caspase-8 n=1 Tax=Pieris napi TaxID=78633 RepID=UPI001FBA0734|nr:caspase-8 [Pieris napi]